MAPFSVGRWDLTREMFVMFIVLLLE
jgi:hypothetical protein